MTRVDAMAVNGVPFSARERERWTPEHYTAEAVEGASPPVYLLAPLRESERGAMLRALIGTTGTLVSVREVRAVLRDGAVETLEPEQASAVNAALDELLELEGVKDPDEQITQRLEVLRGTVERWEARISRRYEPLRELLAANLAQGEALEDLTVRSVLRDWEGLPAKCIRRGGLVIEEAMQAIPERDLSPLRVKCRTLREVSRDQEPDSASP